MSLPRFPSFKPVALEDRDFIQGRLDRFPWNVCELNFANIFIWRNSEHPLFSIVNGNLCILVEPDFEPAYFLPPIGESRIEETIEACLAKMPRLSRVPEEFLRKYGSLFRAQEDRGNFDYIYRTVDLAGLRGKKYEGKRNRVRKFESSYDFVCELLDESCVDDCRRLLEAWFVDKDNSDPYMKAKKEAIYEALSHFTFLGLEGRVVKIDGRVEAFTLGTRLTEDTAVVQIEIANSRRTGLAQWINREFARTTWADYEFINREQDLGVPGLRKAKLSYRPCRLQKKYHLTLPAGRG